MVNIRLVITGGTATREDHMETTKQLTIYIAGPMRGYERNNHDEFDKAEDYLVKQKIYKPVNPAKIDRECGVNPEDNMTKLELRSALWRDANRIFDECDSMYMLRGWEHSTGARMEHAIAVALGIGIFYQ